MSLSRRKNDLVKCQKCERHCPGLVLGVRSRERNQLNENDLRYRNAQREKASILYGGMVLAERQTKNDDTGVYTLAVVVTKMQESYCERFFLASIKLPRVVVVTKMQESYCEGSPFEVSLVVVTKMQESYCEMVPAELASDIIEVVVTKMQESYCEEQRNESLPGLAEVVVTKMQESYCE